MKGRVLPVEVAVLEAYGWDDLAKTARCEFLLDYEEEEDEEVGNKRSKKKSLGDSAGRTISATKSSLASWNSTHSVPRKRHSPERRSVP